MNELALAVILLTRMAAPPVPKVLPRAYSHNDYKQKRPLDDALDRGFCAVEADVHLRDGELMVAHTGGEIKPGVTLKSLYLEPLRARVKAGHGRVYPDGPSFILMVEFKSDADESWIALAPQLEEYRDMLTVFTDDGVKAGAVTVVITGRKPDAILRALPRRLAAIDGDLGDRNAPEKTLFPVISDNWASRFEWRGGRMDPGERARLHKFVREAHDHGRLIRFWGAPDREESWEVQREAGVDLINTNKLEALRVFLTGKRRRQ